MILKGKLNFLTQTISSVIFLRGIWHKDRVRRETGLSSNNLYNFFES